MFRRMNLMTLAVAAMCMMGAAPVSAVTLIANFGGVLNYLYTPTGEFNSAPAGQAFSASYTYDSVTMVNTAASLTISGVTATINPVYVSLADMPGGAVRFYAGFDDGQRPIWHYQTMNMTLASGSGVTDLTVPIAMIPATGAGQFEFLTADIGGAGLVHYASGNVVVTSFSITDPNAVGGVPEPESWALMVLGFGGVGAAARARRRAGSKAVAA